MMLSLSWSISANATCVLITIVPSTHPTANTFVLGEAVVLAPCYAMWQSAEDAYRAQPKVHEAHMHRLRSERHAYCAEDTIRYKTSFLCGTLTGPKAGFSPEAEVANAISDHVCSTDDHNVQVDYVAALMIATKMKRHNPKWDVLKEFESSEVIQRQREMLCMDPAIPTCLPTTAMILSFLTSAAKSILWSYYLELDAQTLSLLNFAPVVAQQFIFLAESLEFTKCDIATSIFDLILTGSAVGRFALADLFLHSCSASTLLCRQALARLALPSLLYPSSATSLLFDQIVDLFSLVMTVAH